MHAVRLSRDYRLTVPRRFREALALEPGQMLDVSVVDGRIVIVPIPSAAEARGFLRGIDTVVPRDRDRV